MDSKAAQAAFKARQLPAKEAALFKTLLQQYELKQHKKGVKAADQILKKCPNHGETLAIKALIIHSSLPHNHPTPTSQPKGEEADHLIKVALAKDPYSHITHHVQSIMARANKDWETAYKALTRAREIDPDNIPLIRDSISLLTHMRKYDEAIEVRHRLFLLRPAGRSAWIGLAVGHELAGDFDEAIRILEGLKDLTKSEGDGGLTAEIEKRNFELWLMSLYVRAGKFAEALEKLEDDFRDRILTNQGEASELHADLLVKVGRVQEAEDAYRELLESNPDKLDYYRALLRCKGLDLDSELSSEQRTKVLFILDGFCESYPRASVPKRLALDVAEREDFTNRATAYIIAGLERAVPSLFVDIKGLYGDKDKLKAVEDIVTDMKAKLEAGEGLQQDSDADSPPTALLWLYYFMALHYAHPSHPSPDYAQALRLLEQADSHTPTLPEINMARALVYKRAGDPEAAAKAMEDARLLDGQDRFLNGKAGKYWLRAGEVHKASETFGLFTKQDTPTPGHDLTDMQCTWFLQEEGDAFNRAGKLGKALKRYKQVITIFQDYDDDQYDFHTYALRKATFMAYDSLIAYEDRLRADKNYVKAAMSATAILFKVYDSPDLRELKLSPEEEAERKRAAKKAQKAGSKAKKAAAHDPKKEEQSIPDPDPEGTKLLKDVDALSEISRLLRPLQRLLPRNIEVQLASFELYHRQKQHLRALQALCRASAIDAEDPQLHSQIVRFKLAFDELSPAPAHAPVIKNKLQYLIPESQSLLLYNSDFVQRHPSSPRHIMAGSVSLRHILMAQSSSGDIAADDKARLEQMIGELTGSEVVVDIDVYEQALRFLVEDLKSDVKTVDMFKAGVKAKAPLAMKFASKVELEKRRMAWAEESKEVVQPNGA